MCLNWARTDLWGASPGLRARRPYPGRSRIETKLKLLLAAGVSLLCASIGLNVWLLGKMGTSEADHQPEPGGREGVTVRSLYHTTLIDRPGKITLRDIEREFLDGIERPRLAIIPRYRYHGRAQSYHEIHWKKPLPDGYQLELAPGDEVLIRDEFPALDGFLETRVTNLNTGIRRATIGNVMDPLREFGYVVASDIRRGDAEGGGREVIRITGEDRERLQEWIAGFDKLSRSYERNIHTVRTEAPTTWLDWTWPAGSTHQKIGMGDHSVWIYHSDDFDFVLHSYDYD